MDEPFQRIKPLFFSAIYYYMGFYLLRNVALYPVFRVFLIASVVLILLLMIVSFVWKISIHMAGMGGITGLILAVSFKMGFNPVGLIAGIFLVAGLVGTARLYLGRHTLGQVLWGYAAGLVVLYLSILYS
jgi:membrane-associated phospholipid phosphatase